MIERLKVWGLVALLVGFGLLAFVQTQTPLAWGLVPLLLSGAWMLGDSRRLIAGYWLWAVVAEYVYQTIGFGPLRYGDEALLLMIVVAIVFTQSIRRQAAPDLNGMVAVVLLLLALALLSYLVNRGDPLTAAVTVLQYYRPFVLGYLAYIAIRPENLPAAAVFFVITLLAQLAINASWALGLNLLPHPGYYTGVDFAVGSMGSALHVGYTACLGIILCAGVVIAVRRWAFAVMGVLLFASFVLTSTIHAYSFLAASLLALSITVTGRLGARLATATGMTAVLASMFLLVQALFPDTLEAESFLARGRDLLGGRKLAAYSNHLTELHRDVPVFLLGAGPGNLGCAMADSRAYLPAKYHGWGFEKMELLEIASGSIIGHTRTGFLSIWSDMGPIAFLLYWGAHFYAMFRVVRFNARGAYELPWQRAFALSFVPAMLFYLMVAFMVDLVHSALWGFYPWVWAAVVWTPQKAARSEEAEDNSSVAQNATDARPAAALADF